jgi:hypothetical protein
LIALVRYTDQVILPFFVLCRILIATSTRISNASTQPETYITDPEFLESPPDTPS